MKVISANNVNDAFRKGVDLFRSDVNFRRQESRNGTTLECVHPVTTVYDKPWERVLLEKTRDANPFFHLVEAIWMMAGSENLRQLTHFNDGMKRFSDDGKTLNGAYGHRWLNTFKLNQIETVVSMLKKDPDSRRCVIQMWNAVKDLNSSSIDIPCNTNIYFKIREDELQMTVCNRSNDMSWGAYGANVVHMSVLQEYIAARLDLPMGKYYQISDSFHIYETEQWEKIRLIDFGAFYPQRPMYYPKKQIPVVNHPQTFLYECKYFLNCLPVDKDLELSIAACNSISWDSFKNGIFPFVIEPMIKAFTHHKKRDYVESYREIEKIQAEDWQEAAFAWIKKRQLNWEAKHGTGS